MFLEKYQYVFLSRNGANKTTEVLNSVLIKISSDYKDLVLGMLDVSKVFNFVSYNTVLKTTKLFGAPKELLMYIRSIIN